MRVSPLSISLAAKVYEYPEPPVASVTGVEVIVGASLTLLTVIVKDCVSTAEDPSVAFNTTEWLPTSLFVGVPDSTPVAALKLKTVSSEPIRADCHHYPHR